MSKRNLTKLKSLSAAIADQPTPDKKWQAEEALRCITRAEEFKRDRPLMREVKKLAKTQVKAVCK